MSIKKLINNREIRSFRLRYRMLLLSSFLKNKDSLGMFMFSDTLQPSVRQEIAEEFNKREIKVNSIAKSILKAIFVTKGWYNIRKLLEGGVVLVKDKKNGIMSKENIKYVLSDKRFFFKLFF